MVPLSAFQKKKSRILRQMSLIPRNLKKMSHAADVPRRPRPTQPRETGVVRRQSTRVVRRPRTARFPTMAVQ